MNDIWTPLINVLPESSSGIAKIEHYSVSGSDSKFSYLRRSGVDPGNYTRLFVKGSLMMSDTAMEKRSNHAVVRESEGDVLIAGLGIGMIALPIISKNSVQSVTIVEKHADVINLVLPHLKERDEQNKLSVINADIFDWKPDKGIKFDCIYFDIWPDICTDNLVPIAKLHQKFKSHLKGKRWMDSWMKEQLKAQKRTEKRRGEYW